MSVEFMYVYGIIIFSVQNFFSMYVIDSVLERRIKNTLLNYTILSVFVLICRRVTELASSYSGVLGFLAIVIFYFSTNVFLYKGSRKKTIIFTLVFMLLGIVSEAFTTVIVKTFLNFKMKDYNELSVQYMDNAIGYVFILQIMFVLTFSSLFFYQRKEKGMTFLEVSFLEMILFYQLISSILFYYSCKEYNGFSAAVGMVMVLFSLATDIYLPRFITKMKESRETQKQYNELIKQRAKELQYYEKQYQRIENSRILRHEFANYLQTVQELVRDKEHNEAAKELLKDMEQQLDYHEV